MNTGIRIRATLLGDRAELRGDRWIRGPRGSRASRGRAGGFTLLEILLATTILFIGMTAILGFLSLGAALARTAQLRGASAQAIEAVLADLEENAFGQPEASASDADGSPTDGFPGADASPLGSLAQGAWSGAPADVKGRAVPGHPGLVYDATFRPNPDGPEPSAEGLLRAPSEYRVDVELSWSLSGRRRTKRFTTLLIGEVPFAERMRRTFVEGAAVRGRADLQPSAPRR